MGKFDPIRTFSGLHQYSTDERVVGTWIDGKPIYEKAAFLSASTSGWSNAWHENVLTVTDSLETLVRCFPINTYNQVGDSLFGFSTTGVLRVYHPKNVTIGFYGGVFWYTKTTD